MPIKIHNKDYTTVAERVASFVKDTENKFDLVTEVVSDTETHIDVRCTITLSGTTRTGWAREYYEDKNKRAVNFANALENAETSAVGRALAWFGYGGDHIASAEEIERVEGKRESKSAYQKKKSPTTEKSPTDKKKVEAETKTNGSQGLNKQDILDALRGAVGEDVLNDKQAVFNVADKLFNEGKKGFNANKLKALSADKLNLILDEIKKQIEEINK